MATEQARLFFHLDDQGRVYLTRGDRTRRIPKSGQFYCHNAGWIIVSPPPFKYLIQDGRSGIGAVDEEDWIWTCNWKPEELWTRLGELKQRFSPSEYWFRLTRFEKLSNELGCGVIRPGDHGAAQFCGCPTTDRAYECKCDLHLAYTPPGNVTTNY